jgi:hypothetical protein
MIKAFIPSMQSRKNLLGLQIQEQIKASKSLKSRRAKCTQASMGKIS